MCNECFHTLLRVHCKVNQTQDFSGLRIGSLAVTVSQGILGTPAPDMLMADTLNSYDAPSKMSFTANFVSAQIKKRQQKIDLNRIIEQEKKEMLRIY